MNRYQQQLEGTGLPNKLNEVEGLLGQISADHGRSCEEHAPGLLERLESVIDFVRTRVDLTDFTLWWPELGRTLHDRMEQVRASLAVFVDSQDPAQLDAIDQRLNALVERATRWPVSDSGVPADAISRAAEGYRRSLGQRTASLWKECEALEHELSNLGERRNQLEAQMEQRAEEASSRLSEIVTNADESVASANTKLQELEAQIKADKGRLDSAIAEYQRQFAEMQDTRSKRFDDLLLNARTSAEELLDEAKGSASNLVDQIEAKLSEASNLVDIIATTGVTHEFSKEARDQKQQADRWRGWAISLGLGAVAGVGWAVAAQAVGDPDVMDTVAKLFGGLVFFGLARYAANQSSRHRVREETARRLEMDLVSFGSFVHELPPPKQAELREKLVDTIFGRPIGEYQGTNQQVAITEEHVTLLGHILEVIQQRLGKIGP